VLDKEAWQMTRAEYVGLFEGKPQFVEKGSRPSDVHEYLVSLALSEGKTVPPEVLADYPDIKPSAVNPLSSEELKWEQLERDWWTLSEKVAHEGRLYDAEIMELQGEYEARVTTITKGTVASVVSLKPEDTLEKAKKAVMEALKGIDISPRAVNPGAPKTIIEAPTFEGAGFRVDIENIGIPRDATAADVIRFEEGELGNVLGVSRELLKELENYSARDVIWVTKEKKDAAYYLSEGMTKKDISEVTSVKGGRIIASDEQGGFLVLRVQEAGEQRLGIGAQVRASARQISDRALSNLINAVPDVNDTLEVNYWEFVGDELIYLEGWCDACLAYSGWAEASVSRKLDYFERDTPKILKHISEDRGFELVEGGFVETPDATELYGVTWGVYRVPSPLTAKAKAQINEWIERNQRVKKRTPELDQSLATLQSHLTPVEVAGPNPGISEAGKKEDTQAIRGILPLMGIGTAAVVLFSILARTFVLGRHVSYQNGEYLISVRFPGEWHDIREFVQPSNPDVLAIYSQIGPDAWKLFDFVCRCVTYRLDTGEFWFTPSETLAQGRADCEDTSLLLCSLLRNFTDAKVALGDYCGFGHAWCWHNGQILETTYTRAGIAPDPENYTTFVLFDDREVIELWPGALNEIFAARRGVAG